MAMRTIPPFFRGQLLMFDRRAPGVSTGTALGLLAVFVVLEYVVGPRAGILTWLHIPQPPTWERVIGLGALAVVAATSVARATPADIGLIAPGKWTATESLYLAQLVGIGAVIFIVLNLQALRFHAATVGGMWSLVGAVLTQLLWGFYQELVYRGFLQTALVQRIGNFGGVAVANAAFTFGPLHFSVLAGRGSPESKAIFVAATFAIGLLFGYIGVRTRNVVLIGILHGIGDVFSNVPHALG